MTSILGGIQPEVDPQMTATNLQANLDTKLLNSAALVGSASKGGQSNTSKINIANYGQNEVTPEMTATNRKANLDIKLMDSTALVGSASKGEANQINTLELKLVGYDSKTGNIMDGTA